MATKRLLGAVVLGCMLASGCGGDGDPAATSPATGQPQETPAPEQGAAPEPVASGFCDQFPVAEIEAAIGTVVAPLEQGGSDPERGRCAFRHFGGGPEGADVEIEFDVSDGGTCLYLDHEGIGNPAENRPPAPGEFPEAIAAHLEVVQGNGRARLVDGRCLMVFVAFNSDAPTTVDRGTAAAQLRLYVLGKLLG